MGRVKALLLVAILFLGVTYVAAASGGETKNDLGVVVGYVWPSSDSTISGIKFEADSTIDYGVEYKHRFLASNRLSVGGTVLFANYDAKAAGTKFGDIDNTMFLVDANWHFLANKALYVGATLGYSDWGNLNVQGVGGVNTKSNTVYGLNLGYDIPIGKRWAILTNLRYLSQKVETDVSGGGNISVDVNPIIANVGFAWRF